ncbi:hypothetical protein VNO77_34790 [Canavalia gladiata]|uniref:Uncharacterized protein n=1 Tax=Canavalia gladiata TaxID=3824 RepID=A0AAN9PXF6_CANGL
MRVDKTVDHARGDVGDGGRMWWLNVDVMMHPCDASPDGVPRSLVSIHAFPWAPITVPWLVGFYALLTTS